MPVGRSWTWAAAPSAPPGVLAERRRTSSAGGLATASGIGASGTASWSPAQWVKGDEEVTVAFVGQGVKRLIAAYAGLERA